MSDTDANVPLAEAVPESRKAPEIYSADLPIATSIKASVVPPEITFHMVTVEQVDSYAQLGHGVQFLGAAAGLALGAVFGLVIALLQGGLTQTSQTIILMSLAVSVAGGLIAGALSLYPFRSQRTAQRKWLTRSYKVS